MEEQPPAGGLNLLDLKGRPVRRQGVYWTIVIVSIVVHGGFLAYVLGHARPPAQPRPRIASIDIETIGTPGAALRRGDREDVAARQTSPEARADQNPPPARLDADSANDDAFIAGAKALADGIDAPLPEDSARAAKPFPIPERLPARRLAANPPAIAATRSRAERGMALPARRLAESPAEARLSERSAADPYPEDRPTPLPPLELLVMSDEAGPAPGSDESRASALDMGAQGSPVVAVLPKEAGISMFAARIIEGAQMLPEDRSTSPAAAQPEVSIEDSRPVPLPMRRSARRAAASSDQPERDDQDDAGPGSARGGAESKTARAYRAKVRAHLAANRPTGGSGYGRVVVAFLLSSDGGLRSARIVRSSGRPALDQSVSQSVYRAEPFPKPPKGLRPAQLRFVIPFEFR